MGLFSGMPDDLAATYKAAMAVAYQMRDTYQGNGNPEVLETLISGAVTQGQQARTRLLAEGREREWKRFRKSLYRAGAFLDIPPYNRMYEPFVRKYFSDLPATHHCAAWNSLVPVINAP
jgi:hypothetical protein